MTEQELIEEALTYEYPEGKQFNSNQEEKMAEKTYEKFDYKRIEPGSGFQKVTLRFDKPQEGDSEFGHWVLYGVNVNGVQASWFVSQEIKELLTKLKVRKDEDLLIRTEYYTKHNEKGEAVPDVYGVLEYAGKEYAFGKQENGKTEKKEPEPVETTPKEEKPDQTYDNFVCEKFSLALAHVISEMKALYNDKESDHVGFSSVDVQKMVVSVFMALCKG